MKKYIQLLLIISLLLTGCSNTSNTEDIFIENDLKHISKVDDQAFKIFLDNKWQEINIKSVDLNDKLPGLNKKLEKDQYLKWIEDIDKLNANTIKLDRLFPPDFYKALNEYNESSDKPIYIIQSIPMDRVDLEANPDPFKLDNIVPFKNKISASISAIHGDITIPNLSKEKENFSFGKYEADVSKYNLAWIIAPDISSDIVKFTNDNRQDKEDFQGKYISSKKARPFEVFIADILEYTLEYEAENYNWHRPISFLNKLNANLNSDEDKLKSIREFVYVNPNNIEVANNNFFVSYDLSPYKIKYLNTNPRYNQYIDKRGKTNSFAGFLRDFISLHNNKIFAYQYAFSSSRGIDKVNTSSFNKGRMSEVEQGLVLANFYEDIISYGGLGGSIHSLLDDWTLSDSSREKLDNTNRRKLWLDAENSDQHFGLLKFKEDKIFLDGDAKDWKKEKIEPIFTRDKKSENPIKSIYLTHDVEYLYMAIDLDEVDYSNLSTLISIDTIDKQGNTSNPFNKNIVHDSNIDFLVNINEKIDSQILVDSYYNINNYKSDQVENSDEIDSKEENSTDKSNKKDIFEPITTKVNIDKNIVDDNLDEELYMDFNSGKLLAGNTNPESTEFNSLADYYISPNRDFIEIRLAWSLLNFSDPSSKEILGDMAKNGLDSRLNIDELNFSIAIYDKDNPKEFYTFPSNKNGKIDKLASYKWESWNELEIVESYKASYHILKDFFENY